MTLPVNNAGPQPCLFDATVVANRSLCREHYRLTLRTVNLSAAVPGQFLHLAPAHTTPATTGGDRGKAHDVGVATPLLRRAFSIAALKSMPDGSSEVDVIYRVVGKATRWMETLQPGGTVSTIGPLGNAFPIDSGKPFAWLVGGGVGLPPMLWLAHALKRAHRKTLAFVGARSADLVALTINDPSAVPHDARNAALAAEELTAADTPVVLSTDDGSIGYHGHAASALATYYENTPVPPNDLTVYTCGPEIMMETVARFCIQRSIACYVCMERAMACGTGTCQSCVVAVRDESDIDGWRYELCCTQGPVFDASRVIWSDDPGGGDQH